MSELSIQIEKIPNLDKGAVVVVKGSIDAKTVIQFQRKLNSVIEDGTNQIIVDMEQVKYVNSTGLGYLINLADTVGGDSGSVVFANVQPKVKVVFDMLGLNAFFKMFNSRDQALKAIAGGKEPAPAAKPTPSQAKTASERTQPMQAPPRQATPQPTPRQAPQRPAPQPAAGPQRTATPAPARVQQQQPQQQQQRGAPERIQIECKLCKAALIIEGTGTYKCPRCFAMFNYSGSDRLIFLPKRPIYPVQMTLNFSKECTEGLLAFVGLFAQRSSGKSDAANGLQKNLRTVIDNIQQHAYGGNPNNIYHVQVITKDTDLEMRFVDYGRPMNEQTFAQARSGVDRLEIRPHPRGGNILTVAKRLG